MRLTSAAYLSHIERGQNYKFQNGLSDEWASKIIQRRELYPLTLSEIGKAFGECSPLVLPIFHGGLPQIDQFGYTQ